LPDFAFAVFVLEDLPDPNQLTPDFVELTLEGFLVFEVVDFEYVLFFEVLVPEAVFVLEALPDPNQLPLDFAELTLEGFLVFDAPEVVFAEELP